MKVLLMTAVFLASFSFTQAQTLKTAKTQSKPTSSQTSDKVKPPSSITSDQAKPAVQSLVKDLSGHWITANKANIIQFSKAGDTYQGKIVWMRQPNDKNGKPTKDVKNPDKSKRNNPIIGSVMLYNLKYNPKSGYYEGGKAYHHNLGRTVDCKVKLMNNGKTLEVVAMSGTLLSRTAVWTRTNGVPTSAK